MVKKSNKKIPIQNYIIAIVIIAVVIALAFYIFKWVKVLNEDKLSTSYLVSTNTIVYEIKDMNEITDVFSEAPSEYFVYVSYTNDEDVYNLEKDLKKIITDYGLKDYFYYINVTEMIDESDYVEKINNELNLTDDKISKVPVIIYFKDGEVAIDGIVEREDNAIMQAADFEHLLEIKEIKKISQ